jgi:tight adherence protein B
MGAGDKLVIVTAVAVVFASVLLAIQSLYWYLQTRKEEQQRELSRRLGTGVIEGMESLFNEARGSLGDVAGPSDALVDLLVQAGNPYTLSTLILRMCVGAMLGMILFSLALPAPIGLLGVAVGYLPVMSIKKMAYKRMEKITEQLPEALDLVCRSLQSGHGISESMRMVAEEMSQPVAGEFGRVYEEHNLGRDFREAMNNLVSRNKDNFDLKIFVSSTLLQRDTGGNLIEILGNISNTIRQRFIFRGKVLALTSEAKFSAWILGGLPFMVAGLLLYMQPSYLKPLVTDPLGQLMLGYCIVSFFLGAFVMKELSKVDV